METKGECNCGAVKVIFRFTGDQQLGSILCHCINCKKSSGSSLTELELVGSNFMIVPREALSVEGQLTSYSDNNCESGNVLERRFCGVCGSPIIAYTKALNDSLCIPIPPVAHTYLEDAPDWMPRVDGTTFYKRAFGGSQV
ncbi:Mss4-like protein [Thelonectria olida]|uniref:Mss4-like protein n=1 Tax=Thelonectria olida TaxID=1576542 RepID=A0A9P8VPC5_9HYPO|nr:Mss4-like protein [Thelonectria olida]